MGSKAAETKAQKQTGVEVVYSGQYVAKLNDSKVPRDYKIKIKISDDPNFEPPHSERLRVIGYQRLVEHYFKSHITDPDFPYKDFVRVRTVHLHEVINHNKQETVTVDHPTQKTIDNMSIDELVLYASLQGLDVDVRNCPTIDAARKMVSDALDNRNLEAKAKDDKDRAAEIAEKEKFSDVEDIMSFVGA